MVTTRGLRTAERRRCEGEELRQNIVFVFVFAYMVEFSTVYSLRTNQRESLLDMGVLKSVQWKDIVKLLFVNVSWHTNILAAELITRDCTMHREEMVSPEQNALADFPSTRSGASIQA
jgi:hypothetical protein